MSSRLVIVPRWGGGPESDWYPWLQHELKKRTPQPFDPILPANLPHPQAPVLETWVAGIRELAGTDPSEIARTVFVGHSSGCRAILHYIAMLPHGSQVQGVLCVAGWWTVDHPWASLLPWINTPVDLAQARQASKRFVTLISNNDRHTADWNTNRRLWKERLGAEVVVVPGANHFNDAQQPAVLQALLDHFA